MANILTLIDADSLCFQSSRNTLEESILTLNEKIQNIYEKTQCTHAAFFISKGKYFRHEISNGTYKANRGKYISTLKYLKTLKSYLEEEYQANWMEGVEADDLCNFWYVNPIFIDTDVILSEPASNNSKIITNKILVATDKDLLNSIPNTFNDNGHFNYTYKLEDKANPDSVIKGWWVETTDEEAKLNWWKSMIIGDATDGISGCNGKGKVFADKLYTDYKSFDYYKLCMLTYINIYGESQGMFEFQKNYRLLHLLSTDEDFAREIGKLPQLPKIIELNKITTNNNNSDGIDELFK